MKKLFLAAIIAVFSLGVINAQGVKFGAKGGLNIAMLSGKSVEDGKALPAFHVGAVAELGLSEKFAIQPELVYSLQGGQRDGEVEALGVVGKSNAKFKYSYLNIPVMAKYFVTEGLSLEFGPQIGFLMSAKLDTELTFAGETQSNDQSIKDDTKSIDFGLGLGAGYRLENGLSFGARYNLGLSNMADTDNNEVDNNTEYKNGVFQFSVGYFFN